jgi:hypothetical protein
MVSLRGIVPQASGSSAAAIPLRRVSRGRSAPQPCHPPLPLPLVGATPVATGVWRKSVATGVAPTKAPTRARDETIVAGEPIDPAYPRSWHASCVTYSCTRRGKALEGALAGNRNRAGQAHTGVAKGPNVGGHSAPFFFAPVLARCWWRRPSCAARERLGKAFGINVFVLGADARRGAEQGGSGLPRRVSTLVSSDYVQRRRNRSVASSLRLDRRRRKGISA